jgi:DHA1 family bicyclomycin/chloramphenicol resistance-like MFS transporter
MDSGRDYTGAAAAIVGAIGFVFGGIVSPIVGLGDIPLTTSIVLIVCSAASWMMARAVSGVYTVYTFNLSYKKVKHY